MGLSCTTVSGVYSEQTEREKTTTEEQFSGWEKKKKKKEKSKQKHLKRDVSEVREEWPVDAEGAHTQITTFVPASVASDPKTPWTLKRWSTAARRKKKKKKKPSTQGAVPASEEPETGAARCPGF